MTPVGIAPRADTPLHPFTENSLRKRHPWSAISEKASSLSEKIKRVFHDNNRENRVLVFTNGEISPINRQPGFISHFFTDQKSDIFYLRFSTSEEIPTTPIIRRDKPKVEKIESPTHEKEESYSFEGVVLYLHNFQNFSNEYLLKLPLEERKDVLIWLEIFQAALPRYTGLIRKEYDELFDGIIKRLAGPIFKNFFDGID